MVDVEAAVDALLATEQRNPGVAGEEQRGRKRCRNNEAAYQNTAASSAASGSNLLKSETEHSETLDVNTFPISCFLEKDARGVYTISGCCCLCDQTFRAVGTVRKGKVHPW